VAATRDGSLLLAYLPAMPPTVGEIGLDTAGMSRGCRAAWWDPATAAVTPVKRISAGGMRFVQPDGGDTLLAIGATPLTEEK
jgi:hypothetical protein